MLKQLTLGAAIVAGALLLTPTSTPASAAPLAPVQSGVADGDNLVQEAHWRRRHWRRHHHHWRHHHHYYPYYWGYYYRPYYYRPHYYYDDWRWHRRHHRHWHHHHW